jgi:CDP-diacylglycerol--glycerol-3-phosphate 3-phosphatidyltransferase
LSLVPRGLAASFRGGVAPVARALHGLGIRANTVTVLGFALTVVGSVLLATAQPVPALAVLLLGALCDTLDGQLARVAGGGTRFGGFLDSTLDRLSDAALAIAAVQLGATLPDAVMYGDGLILLVASFLVSYIRAKAESLGERASVGIAPREARIALYLVGVAAWAVTGSTLYFAVAVAVAAFLATVTVIQRIAHMANALNEKERLK